MCKGRDNEHIGCFQNNRKLMTEMFCVPFKFTVMRM